SVEKKIKEYDKKRTLFLFDHVADAERAIDKIMNKLPNEPILEITGLNTRSNSRRKPTGDEKFIVATNAAERGLNMKLEVAHIEPGLYLENLKQRLGRIARGESGTTYIHVNTDIVKQISTEISSDEDLFLKLEPIKPGSRDFYMTKVERVLSAYLYLVYKSSIGSLKFQVDSITFKGDCFSDLKKFDSLIPVFKESAGEIIDKKDIKCIEEWWLGYLRAYGFFRGQSTNVKVALPRIDHKQSVMDIVWLKKWTEYEPPEATDPERIFTVKSYRDLPRRVALQFNFCGKFTIDESVFKDSSSYRSTWEKQLNDFFDRYELDIQIYGNEKLKNCVAEMKKLIPGILKPLYPTIIPPVEVGELKDELFL
ncbi:MAG: helicase C-terminal domain-containing protein, partial [Thermoplasmatales archaeon]